MSTDVVEVSLKIPVPHTNGYALFLGNEEKTIVIYVDAFTGEAIRMASEGIRKERPLTHDLIGFILQGFDITLKRVLINDVVDSTFFARLQFQMDNEIGRKFVEIDARPSDSIALAMQTKAPIYIARHVFDTAEDMTEIMDRILGQKED
ncbi:MAG: hypothetical protein BWY82_02540 [Verrucomicrobia bacterium ADurb.Bin474]|nr:MAG: hypothetical protein BWY82_02540 [Verrucomicrobia bacterium ADurb.Bin474]